MKLTEALPIATSLFEQIAPVCDRIEIVGSFKRRKAEVGDLEFLLILKPGTPAPVFGKPKEIYKTHLDKLLAEMERDGLLRQAVNKADGDRLKRREIVGVNFITGFNLELFIVTPATWGLQCTIRTGSSWFSHRTVTNQNAIAFDRESGKKAPGFLPNDLRYVKGKDLESGESCIKRGDEIIPLPEEADVFDLVFGHWIDPTVRAAYADATK
jgi:DNA polymerase/3'-5' exonuclease PolX